jgi:hypothetical protein
MHAEYADTTLTTLENDLQSPQVLIRYRKNGKELEIWAGSPRCGGQIVSVHTKAYLRVSPCHCRQCRPNGTHSFDSTEIPVEDIVDIEVKRLPEWVGPNDPPYEDLFFTAARWLLNRYRKLKRLALDE